MSTELGVAYLSLAASTKDFARDVKAALRGVEADAGRTGDAAGSSLGRKLTKGLKFGVLGVAGLAAAVAGLAAKGGVERALKIEGAQAKLKGLGHDTEAVDAIMKNALASVKGTAFGLGEAATTAAGAVAAGIKPGEQLEKMLKSVANSAAAAGVDMNDMGGIFNKVASIGKAQNDVLQQVADKGIPIYSALAEQLGVTSEEVFKMASAGKIDFATFETAMTKATGTVAEEMGNTLPGKIANFKAAMSRMGEQVVGKVLPYVSDGLSWVTDKIDLWGPAAKDAGDKLGESLGKVAGWLRDDLVPALQDGYKWLSEHFVPALRDSVTWVKENSTWLGPLAVSVATAAAAWQTYTAVTGFAATVLPALKIGIAGVNATLKANPIGIIITAVAALVAGLVWFFTQTETGRAIVAKAWSGIKAAISAVADWWTNTAQPALTAGWDAIKGAAKAVADWYMNTLQPVFTAVWGAISDTASAAAGWYQQHVAPVFQAFGELVRAVIEEWVEPAMALLGRLWEANAILMGRVWESAIRPIFDILAKTWQATWALIQGVWDKIGPPLMAYISGSLKTLWAYISGALEGVRIVFETIWNAIKIHVETVLGVMKGIIQAITSAIRGDWSGAWDAIKEVHRTILDGIRRQTENLIGGVAAWLSNAWDTVSSTAKLGWETVRDAIMGVVDPLVARIVDAFAAAKEGVADVWHGIQTAAAAPVNFVIESVWNNGLRKLIGLIPGVDEPKPLGTIKVPPRSSPSRGGGRPVAAFKDGGFVNLPWSARNRDPYLGVTPNGPIRFEGEEFITKRRSTARMNRKHPGLLDYINDHGDLPAFANGGLVTFKGKRFTQRFAEVLAAAERKVVGGFHVSQGGWNPGGVKASGTSHHGDAVDITRPVTTAVVTALRSSGVAAWHRTPSQGPWKNHHIHGVPLPGYGTPKGSAIWQAQDYLRGGNGLGGRDNGPRVAAGLVAGGGSFDEAGVERQPWWELPRKLAEIVTSVNKNLNGEWGDMVKTSITGALDQFKDWAGSRLGFAKGTNSAPAGWSWVGEKGPELMRFRGGEQVLPAMESALLARGGHGGIRIDQITLPAIKTLREVEAFLAELEDSRRVGHMMGA